VLVGLVAAVGAKRLLAHAEAVQAGQDALGLLLARELAPLEAYLQRVLARGEIDRAELHPRDLVPFGNVHQVGGQPFGAVVAPRPAVDAPARRRAEDLVPAARPPLVLPRRAAHEWVGQQEAVRGDLLGVLAVDGREQPLLARKVVLVAPAADLETGREFGQG